MRQLVPLRRLIEEAEENGLDPDHIFVDRSDLLELPEEPTEEPEDEE